MSAQSCALEKGRAIKNPEKWACVDSRRVFSDRNAAKWATTRHTPAEADGGVKLHCRGTRLVEVIAPRTRAAQTVRLDKPGTSSIYSDIMKFVLSAYSAVLTHLGRITTVGAGVTLLSASLAACGSDPAEPADEPADGAILITDANTFTSTAAITLLDPQPVVTAAGASVSVCWPAPQDLTEDLLCHDKDVKTVFLVRIAEPNREAVLDHIVAGDLDSYVESTIRYKGVVGDTDNCALLSEFTDGDDPIQIDTEYFASPDYSYLLVFSAGESAGGSGTISMTFLEPGAGATSVPAPNGCGQLNYTVDLEALTPVAVPLAGPWNVDWRGLTRTGDGQAVKFNTIDRVMVAYYEGHDLPSLEMNIFDLEQLPGAKYWEMPHDGQVRNADLSLVTERGTGAAFPGFQASTTGTWMLALMCDTCASPAPLMLTVLNPM